MPFQPLRQNEKWMTQSEEVKIFVSFKCNKMACGYWSNHSIWLDLSTLFLPLDPPSQDISDDNPQLARTWNADVQLCNIWTLKEAVWYSAHRTDSLVSRLDLHHNLVLVSGLNLLDEAGGDLSLLLSVVVDAAPVLGPAVVALSERVLTAGWGRSSSGAYLLRVVGSIRSNRTVSSSL